MSAITNAERVKALELELDATKRNLADARRKLRERGRHADRIRQAHVDSLVMASHHVSYLNTTRRAAQELGAITPRRWEGAIGLMRLANVHNGERWLLHDLAEITSRLEKAAAAALDCPSAYWARLCKNANRRKAAFR
jgi:hypothetical protein